MRKVIMFLVMGIFISITFCYADVIDYELPGSTVTHTLKADANHNQIVTLSPSTTALITVPDPVCSTVSSATFKSTNFQGGTWNINVTGVITSTTNLASQAQMDTVVASTGDMTTRITNLEVSTGAIKNTLNSVQSDTGTIQTQLTATVVSTGAIKTILNSVQADTGTIRTDLNSVKSDTGTIRTDLNAVIVSTGTLFPKTGGILSGSITMTNYQIVVGTISIGQVLKLTPLGSDPIITDAGTFWERISDPNSVYTSTGNTQDQIGKISIVSP